MPRITVRVDEDTEQWLEDEAERLDRSKAKMGGRCIELLRSESGDHINPQQFDATEDSSLMQVDSSRIDEHDESIHALKDRVRDLEARLSTLEAEEPHDAHASAAGARREDDSPTPEEESLRQASSGSQQPPDAGGTSRDGQDLRERAESALDDLDVPGRAAAVERNRRQAILWAWDYLRQQGTVTSSEIANATLGEFWDVDLNYTVSTRYPGYGLWDSCVRDALKKLPGVDAPPEKGNRWKFVED